MKKKFSVQQYLKNVAKSTVYTAADVLGENFESIKEFKSTNAEAAKTVYNSVKDYRTTFKKAKNYIMSSDVYAAANIGIQSLIEDLQTGNFYNKEREAEIADKFGGSVTNFEDWDMDNEDFDWDDGNLDVSDGEKIVATTIKKQSKISSVIISDAVARSGKAVVDSSRENTALLYSQNERLLTKLGGGLDNLTKMLSDKAEYDSKVQKKQIENTNKFFSNMESNINKIVAQLDELLKMQRNLYEGAQEKKSNKKTMYLSDIADGGIPDLKEYFNAVKKNTKDAINELTGGIFSMSEAMGGANLFAQFAANPIGELVSGGLKKLVNKDFKEASRTLDSTFRSMFNTAIVKANNAKNNGSGMNKFLGEILGLKIDKADSNIDTSKYNKGPIPFDGVTRQSIIEVIPRYLRKMTSVLTGEDEEVFDYKSGRWTKLKSVHEKHEKWKKDETSSMKNFLIQVLSKGMGKSAKLNNLFNSYRSQENFDKELDKIAAVLASTGDFASLSDNKYMLDDDLVNILKQILSYNPGVEEVFAGTGAKARQKYKAKINPKRYKEGNMSMLNRLASIYTNTHKSRANTMRTLEEDPYALERILYSEGIQGVEKYNNFRDKYGDYNKKAFDSPLAKSLVYIKDQRGNTLYDYLAAIKTDLTAIRNSGLIGGRRRGGGGNPPGGITPGMMDFEKPGFDSDEYSLNKGRLNHDKNELRNSERYDSDRKALREKIESGNGKDLRYYDVEEFKDLAQYIAAQQTILDNEYNKKIMEDQNKHDKKTVWDRLFEMGFIDKKERDKYNEIKYDPTYSQTRTPTTEETAKKQAKEQKKEARKNAKKASGKVPDVADEIDDEVASRINTSFLEQLKDTKKGVEKLALMGDYIKQMSKKPWEAATASLYKMDYWITKLFFGEDLKTNNDDEDSERQGLFGIIKQKFKNGFEDLTNKMAEIAEKAIQKVQKPLEDLFGPIKKFLFGTKEDSQSERVGGVFGPFMNSISRALKKNHEDVVEWTKREAERLKAKMKGEKSDENSSSSSSSSSSNSNNSSTKNTETRRSKVLDSEEYEIIRNNLKIRTYIESNGGTIEGYLKWAFSHNIYGSAAFYTYEYVDEDGTTKFGDKSPIVQYLNEVENIRRRKSTPSGKKFSRRFGKYMTDYSKNDLINFDTASDLTIRNQVMYHVLLQNENIDEYLEWCNKQNMPGSAIVKKETASRWRREIADENKKKKDAYRNKGNTNRKIRKHQERLVQENQYMNKILNMFEAKDQNDPLVNSYITWCKTKANITRLVDMASETTLNRYLDWEERNVNKLGSERISVRNKINNRKNDSNSNNDQNNELSIFEENNTLLQRIVSPIESIKDNVKRIADKIASIPELFGPRDNSAVGGINKSGRAFQSVVSSGEIINGRTVPPGGPYLTTIPKGGVVINPADKATRTRQAAQERSFLNKIRRNAEPGSSGSGTAVLGKISDRWDDDTKRDSDANTLVRGGIGGLVGLLLGHPLIGAGIGAASSITQSKGEVAKMLFGDLTGEVDENGNLVRQDNGLISTEIQKAVPDVKKWGIGGAIAGLITPFGPLGGLLVGSALGFAKNSELVKGSLFGENGIFTNEQKDKLKKALPKMGIGAAATAFLGPFGLVGNAILGAAGGFVASTDSFKDAIFGKEVDGVRVGGLVGAIKKGAEPLKNFGRDIVDGITDAIFGQKKVVNGKEIREGGIFGMVKDHIVSPIAEGIKPIMHEGKNFFKNLTKSVSKTVSSFMNKYIGGHWIERTLGKAGSVGKLATKLGKGAFGVVTSPLMLGAHAIKGVGNHFRRKQIRTGTADDMTAEERLNFRKTNKFAEEEDQYSAWDRAILDMANNGSIEDMEELKRVLMYTSNEESALTDEEANLRRVFDDKLSTVLNGKDSRRIMRRLRKDDYDTVRHILSGNLKDREGNDITDVQRNMLLGAFEKLRNDRNRAKEQFASIKKGGYDINKMLSKNGLVVDVNNSKSVDKLAAYLDREIAHMYAGETDEDREKKKAQDPNNPLNKNTTSIDKLTETMQDVVKVMIGNKEEIAKKYKIKAEKQEEDRINSYVPKSTKKNVRFRGTFNRFGKEISFDSVSETEVLIDYDGTYYTYFNGKKYLVTKTDEKDENGNDIYKINGGEEYKTVAEKYYENKKEKSSNTDKNNPEGPEPVETPEKQQETVQKSAQELQRQQYQKYMSMKNNRLKAELVTQATNNFKNAFYAAQEKLAKFGPDVSEDGESLVMNIVIGEMTYSIPLDNSGYPDLRFVNEYRQEYINEYVDEQMSKVVGYRKEEKRRNKALKRDRNIIRKSARGVKSFGMLKTTALLAGASVLTPTVAALSGGFLSPAMIAGAGVGLYQLNKRFDLVRKTKRAAVRGAKKIGRGIYRKERYTDKDLARMAEQQWNAMGDENRGLDYETWKKDKMEELREEYAGKDKTSGIIGGVAHRVKSGVKNKIQGLKAAADKRKEEKKKNKWYDKVLEKLDDMPSKIGKAVAWTKDKGSDILKKIFGISKWVVGVPLMLGVFKDHIWPFIKEKVGPVVLGKKDENGEYQGGLISGIVNPIKNFFGDKFSAIKEWFTNTGRFENPNTGMRGMLDNIKNFGVFLWEKWKSGAGAIYQEVFPAIIRAGIANIPQNLEMLGEALVDGFSDLAWNIQHPEAEEGKQSTNSSENETLDAMQKLSAANTRVSNSVDNSNNSNSSSKSDGSIVLHSTFGQDYTIDSGSGEIVNTVKLNDNDTSKFGTGSTPTRNSDGSYDLGDNLTGKINSDGTQTITNKVTGNSVTSEIYSANQVIPSGTNSVGKQVYYAIDDVDHKHPLYYDESTGQYINTDDSVNTANEELANNQAWQDYMKNKEGETYGNYNVRTESTLGERLVKWETQRILHPGLAKAEMTAFRWLGKGIGKLGKFASKIPGSKIAGKVLQRTGGALKAAGSGKDLKIINKIIEKLKSLFSTILRSKEAKKLVADAGEELTEDVIKEVTEEAAEKAGKELGEQVAKKGAMTGAKVVGWVITAAMVIWDFISGYNNARNILQITGDDESIGTWEKVTAGLAKAATEIIPVSEKTIANVFVKWILPRFNSKAAEKIKKQQEEAQDAVDEYNKTHGTKLTLEQYNNKKYATWYTKLKGTQQFIWENVTEGYSTEIYTQMQELHNKDILKKYEDDENIKQIRYGLDEFCSRLIHAFKCVFAPASQDPLHDDEVVDKHDRFKSISATITDKILVMLGKCDEDTVVSTLNKLNSIQQNWSKALENAKNTGDIVFLHRKKSHDTASKVEEAWDEGYNYPNSVLGENNKIDNPTKLIRCVCALANVWALALEGMECPNTIKNICIEEYGTGFSTDDDEYINEIVDNTSKLEDVAAVDASYLQTTNQSVSPTEIYHTDNQAQKEEDEIKTKEINEEQGSSNDSSVIVASEGKLDTTGWSWKVQSPRKLLEEAVNMKKALDIINEIEGPESESQIKEVRNKYSNRYGIDADKLAKDDEYWDKVLTNLTDSLAELGNRFSQWAPGDSGSADAEKLSSQKDEIIKLAKEKWDEIGDGNTQIILQQNASDMEEILKQIPANANANQGLKKIGTVNVTPFVGPMLNDSIDSTMKSFSNINQTMTKLSTKNKSTNKAIDEGNLVPTDSKYWNIKLDNSVDSFTTGLYKFNEIMSRAVKAPFSLVSSMMANSNNAIMSSGNFDSSSSGGSNNTNNTGNSGSSGSSSSSNSSNSGGGNKSFVSKFVSNVKKGFTSLVNFGKSIFGKGVDDKDNDESGFGNGGISNDPFHIYQRNYSGSYNVSGDSEKQTVADSGCGPAAAASVMRMYGQNGDMNNAVKYALNNNYKEVNGGTYPSYFKDYLNKSGISTSQTSSDKEVVKNLAQGKPVIMMGRDTSNNGSTPYGSKYSHYVVARGLDRNGNVIVEDSEDPNGSTRYNLKDTLKNSSIKITTSARGRFGRGNSASSVLGNYVTEMMKAMYGPYYYAINGMEDSSNNSSGTYSGSSGNAAVSSGNMVVMEGTAVDVPADVQTGVTRNYTNYDYWFPKWANNTVQRQLADIWDSQGRPSSKGIAIIDGFYLMALAPKFGTTGDLVSILLEDGTVINGLLADAKGADAQSEWGHVFGSNGLADIIEWEACAGSSSATGAGASVIKIDDWLGKKVTKIINAGKYADKKGTVNGGAVSDSSGSGRGLNKFGRGIYGRDGEDNNGGGGQTRHSDGTVTKTENKSDDTKAGSSHSTTTETVDNDSQEQNEETQDSNSNNDRTYSGDSLVSKLGSYAVDALKAVYGPYWDAIFGQEATNNGAGNGTSAMGNSSAVLYAVSMVAEAIYKVTGTYSHSSITITTRDGKKIVTRPDCTGLMSAAIMYLGYKTYAGGTSEGAVCAIDWSLDNTNNGTSLNGTIRNADGSETSDWIIMPYDKSLLQPGDIVSYKDDGSTGNGNHSEMYVWSVESNGKTTYRGFNDGSSKGIKKSAELGTKYLDTGEIDKSMGSWIGLENDGRPIQTIIRYVGNGSAISQNSEDTTNDSTDNSGSGRGKFGRGNSKKLLNTPEAIAHRNMNDGNRTIAQLTAERQSYINQQERERRLSKKMGRSDTGRGTSSTSNSQSISSTNNSDQIVSSTSNTLRSNSTSDIYSSTTSSTSNFISNSNMDALLNIIEVIADNSAKTDQIIQLLAAIVTNTGNLTTKQSQNQSNTQSNSNQVKQLIQQLRNQNSGAAPLSTLSSLTNGNNDIANAVYSIAKS